MNDFKNCVKIESSFRDDGLIIPRKGQCKIELKDGFADITVKFRKDKLYFNEKIEQATLKHKVII
jgi:hypothetical protein